MRLLPPLHAVTASAACGDSLRCIRLQPPLHTVTASRLLGERRHAVGPIEGEAAEGAHGRDRGHAVRVGVRVRVRVRVRARARVRG